MKYPNLWQKVCLCRSPSFIVRSRLINKFSAPVNKVNLGRVTEVVTVYFDLVMCLFLPVIPVTAIRGSGYINGPKISDNRDEKTG